MSTPSTTAPQEITVIVAIDDRGETTVTAPDHVRVEIRYALAEASTHCSCGAVIRQDEHSNWYHIDAPEIWGGDHDARP